MPDIAGTSSFSPILTITGPTGIGKTELSLILARKLDAEIVSVDSRQIYKELEIGTARPSNEELGALPHHFIAERSIKEPISSGQFAALAEDRIIGILSRGKTPLLVGGSTLYLHALQHGLADIPDVDESVREEMTARFAREGAERLYRELIEVDPVTADTMDPTKSQRLIRALEVYHGTGRPLSSYRTQGQPPKFDFKTIVLDLDRKVLYDRIDRRVDRMFEIGLIAEVEALQARGLDMSLPVLKTIGYKEVIAYLRGDYDFEEMVRLVKRNSRRYAKRQLTWFRRYPEYEWMRKKDDLGETVNCILNLL